MHGGESSRAQQAGAFATAGRREAMAFALQRVGKSACRKSRPIANSELGMSPLPTLALMVCALGAGPSLQPASPQHVTGVVSGEVVRVVPEAGTLIVRVGAGSATLRATPWQLAAMAPGQLVALPYGDYAGVYWLKREVSDREPGSFAISGEAVGTIDTVDRAAGLLVIGQSRFHAHPDMLRGFIPGARVRVRFVEVGEVPWLWDLAPADGDRGPASSAELVGRMVEQTRRSRALHQ